MTSTTTARPAPVEHIFGDVIAEGDASCLGVGAMAHLSFIVGTVRPQLLQDACGHARAERRCPEYGWPAVGLGTKPAGWVAAPFTPEPNPTGAHVGPVTTARGSPPAAP